MGTTLVERVERITDLVRDQSGATEASRRLGDDVLGAIRATGLNRGLLARDLGGDETPLAELLEAIARIAAADGSTGWCAAIGAGSGLFSGYLERAASAEVFADPDMPHAGMFGPFGQARPVDDGFTFSGRWPFASNCLHAGWIGLGSFYFDEAGEMDPIPRVTFVKMDDVEVEDTWTAQGLCGTGSHHAKVDGVTIQRGHSASIVDAPWAEGTLWRLPMFTVLAPALGIVPLGIARGAVDEVQRLIAEGSTSTRGSLREDPVGLADFAMAEARLRAARAGLDAACAHAWDLAERGIRPGAADQARIMTSMSHGCEVAVEVTSLAHRLGGGPAAYAGNRLLRALRDVETARQHIMFGFSHRPMFGQALAGLPTFAPPFIV